MAASRGRSGKKHAGQVIFPSQLAQEPRTAASKPSPVTERRVVTPEVKSWGRPAAARVAAAAARDEGLTVASDPSTSDDDEDVMMDERELEKKLILKVEDTAREKDLQQLERTARELKGKPGLGTIRKTIKKHIRKLQEEARMERAMEADHFGTGTMAGPRTPMGSASPTLAAAAQHAGAPAGQSMPRIFLEKPTTVIDLMPGVVGWVIGKGGQRIKEIMASSQCRMWVDQDVPPDEPRKLHLMGTKGQVDAALKMVNDLLRTAPILQAASQQKGLTADKDGKPTKNPKGEAVMQQSQIVMDCPPHLVGLLIGKKGWTIKKIQQETGAQVSINQNVKEGQPRKIFIAGSQPSVQHAKTMIQEVLSYPGPAAQALLKSPRAVTTAESLTQQAAAQTLAGLAAGQGSQARSVFKSRVSAAVAGGDLGPLASLSLAQASFVDSSDEEEEEDETDRRMAAGQPSEDEEGGQHHHHEDEDDDESSRATEVGLYYHPSPRSSHGGHDDSSIGGHSHDSGLPVSPLRLGEHPQQLLGQQSHHRAASAAGGSSSVLRSFRLGSSSSSSSDGGYESDGDQPTGHMGTFEGEPYSSYPSGPGPRSPLYHPRPPPSSDPLPSPSQHYVHSMSRRAPGSQSRSSGVPTLRISLPPPSTSSSHPHHYTPSAKAPPPSSCVSTPLSTLSSSSSPHAADLSQPYPLFNRAPFSPWSPAPAGPSPRPAPATPVSTPVGGATLFGYGEGLGGVRAFLRRLNLSQYAGVLEAHDVDMDALRLMKETDLQALGVPRPDTLKLMDALMTETATGDLVPGQGDDDGCDDDCVSAASTLLYSMGLHDDSSSGSLEGSADMDRWAPPSSPFAQQHYHYHPHQQQQQQAGGPHPPMMGGGMMAMMPGPMLR